MCDTCVSMASSERLDDELSSFRQLASPETPSMKPGAELELNKDTVSQDTRYSHREFPDIAACMVVLVNEASSNLCSR